MSSLVNLQRRLDGDSRSTAPGQITPLEAMASTATGRTLTVERLVSGLPDLARGAVLCRFVRDRSLAVWASEHGQDEKAAREALRAAVLSVGRAVLTLERVSNTEKMSLRNKQV